MAVGVALVCARSQMPAVRVQAHRLGAGTLGAPQIIKPNGVDFTRLAPLPLRCSLTLSVGSAHSVDHGSLRFGGGRTRRRCSLRFFGARRAHLLRFDPFIVVLAIGGMAESGAWKRSPTASGQSW
jgi:hypothetical protein